MPSPHAPYLACVPHVPFIALQDRTLNAGFWAAYVEQAAAFRAYDPELVFVFGADHYDGQHMRLMPSFAVALEAEAIADYGGYPGPLNVPIDVALPCAEYLIEQGFDIATSWAMEVDHGFSAVLHNIMGSIDARPVVPVFVNSLCHPRPTLRRCRQLGEAIGSFAKRLGKRVAFLGSGGLSHDTGPIFPQVHDLEPGPIRDYLIHGGRRGELTRERWTADLNVGLDAVNAELLARVPGVGDVRPAWDRRFLDLFATGDYEAFDSWKDADILANAGNGAGEIRQWIAAGAAAKAAGAGAVSIDYYDDDTPIAVAAVVVHA